MFRDIASGPSGQRPEIRSGRQVIAVIGIDHYETWPRLHNAVSDAMGTAQLFMRLGFVQVTPPLLDGAATGAAMHRLVTDDLAQLGRDDSLVLFFAGHGHTHTASLDGTAVKTGCVIPVDAVPVCGHMSASWLRLDGWLSDIARLPPRHILVIVDACHSGVALDATHHWRDGGEPTGDLDAIRVRRSRRIITSALDDQRALDSGPYPGHSLFTGCLIDGLSGGLARGTQRMATGRELGQYLHQRVRSYPASKQTPDAGAFELDDRGDIVMPILCSTAPVSAADTTRWSTPARPAEPPPVSMAGPQLDTPLAVASVARFPPAPRPGAAHAQVELSRRGRARIALAIAIVAIGGVIVTDYAFRRGAPAETPYLPGDVHPSGSASPSGGASLSGGASRSSDASPSANAPRPATRVDSKAVIELSHPAPDMVRSPVAGLVKWLWPTKAIVNADTVIVKLSTRFPDDKSEAESHEPFEIVAPSSGSIVMLVNLGQKVAANDVVARVEHEPVPSAVFKVADSSPFVANMKVEVTIDDSGLHVPCTVAGVQPGIVQLTCPLARGASVTLEGPS